MWADCCCYQRMHAINSTCITMRPLISISWAASLALA
jgi:hypothetical protein